MNCSIQRAFVLASIFVCTWASADEAACAKIMAAYVKTGSAKGQMEKTGYDFAKDTRQIYATGTHICSIVKDESIDGQQVTVYRDQYRSAAGNTDASIWVSKTSRMALREEQDGDITGKGKGHTSYRWSSP